MKCPKCNFNNPENIQFCGDCGTKLVNPAAASTESSESPRQELTTGSTFAKRYKIVEELGQGGMGKVYKAIDNQLNEEVAIKLIKPEISSDKKTIKRFSNELKLSRKIGHRNVGRMYELMQDQGAYFITMEYVSGQDLKGLIRQSGQLAVGTTVSIAKQVCEGLIEAHRLGVIHRDLKPNNIMIDKGGNAKIMDFGIARSLSGKSMTKAGAMIGTPEYMSPEQAEGEEVDRRSDIYSLGVILYEMVTGRLPFEGETALSVAMKHKGEIPKDPKEYNPQISDDLSSLILKCLEKEKESRYQEAGELLGELNNIEQGIPTTDRVVPRRKTATSKEITVTLNLRRVLIPALVVVGVVIVGLVVWKFIAPKGSVVIPSIAILPFEDLSPNKDQEHFCKGLAYSIFGSLNNVEGLQVCGINSSFLLKDQGLDIIEIGKRLGADTVLSGSIRKEGNRIRITPVLTDVVNNSTIWSPSKPYDREFKDIFIVEDEIKLMIVENLKINLLGEEQTRLLAHGTESFDAYKAYRMGELYFDKWTHESYQKAQDYFEDAIGHDGNYAEAYVGLAKTYLERGAWWGDMTPKEAFPEAKKAIERAIQLDNTLGEAYTIHGWIKFAFDWDWTGAKDDFQQGIKYSPNSPIANFWYANYLRALGHSDEALAYCKRGLQIDPLYKIGKVEIAFAYLEQGKIDLALENALEIYNIDRDFPPGLATLGYVFYIKGDTVKAIEYWEKGANQPKPDMMNLCFLGSLYAQFDKVNDAHKILAKLEQTPDRGQRSISLVYAALEEKEKAIEWLLKGYEEKDPQMVWLGWEDRIPQNELTPRIRKFTYFHNLRDDPKFIEIVKLMNFPKE